MNFNKIKIVIAREFSIRVKKKSFIFTTVLVPLLMLGLMAVPSLIMLYGNSGEDAKVLMVVDNSGIIAEKLEDSEDIKYQVLQNGNVDTLKKEFETLGADAILEISSLDSANNLSLSSFSKKQLNAKDKKEVSLQVSSILEAYKVANYDIANLQDIYDDIKTKVSMETFTLSEAGEEKKSIVEISMAISYILTFVIYMFIAMFGNMVLRSVIDEKSNRIVEVIVSSIKPFELMIAKIIGVASVALVQFLIWGVLTAVLFVGFQHFVPMEMTSQEVNGMVQDVPMVANSAELGQIVSAITDINFGYILGNFFIYFVLGYLLYAAMFAAIGSAVENEADTQQLILPVTLPLVAGLMMMMHTFQYPDSTLSFWFSIIPFTSPMVMMARIPFEGGVPTWELALSIGLLLGTFLFMVYLAGKIYRVGILMYGKKASWKDLWKWIKY